MRAEWRQLALLVGCLLALALWIALDSGWRQIFAAIAFGAVAAILAIGWMIGFDARSLRFAWGAEGEKRTAEELERLEPQWRVFHDIRIGRGNWDHIAVGPGGIFLIDTKSLSERAVVDDAGLRAGRLRFGGARSRGAAVQLKEAIAHECGRTVWVQSVVAVWGELEGGATERDRVLYVQGEELVDVLRERSQRLSTSEVEDVARAIGVIRAAAS